MKDMYGNPLDVGDIIIFENNSEFIKYCHCPEDFFGKQFEISFICDDWLSVYVPGFKYECAFPLSCVQRADNFEEIPSELVGNILS